MSSLAGPIGQASAGWLRLPSDPAAIRARAVRDGLILAGWILSVAILIGLPLWGRSLGYDAFSYWFTDLDARYLLAQQSLYELGAFRYSPPIGLAFSVFGLLPWWLFLTLWTAVLVACLAWLGGRWTLVLMAFPLVALELYHGNIHLLMAAAVALGFRYPAAWSFVLLTKVTPGIGLLWFAARREWRSLLLALGATAMLVGVSLVVAPHLWPAWWATVATSAGEPAELAIPPPLPVRLIMAAALVTWGARTDRAWTVGIAAMLSLPNLWPHGLVLALAAVPALQSGATSVRPALSIAIAVAVAVAAALILLAAPVIESIVTEASQNVLSSPVPGTPRP